MTSTARVDQKPGCLPLEFDAVGAMFGHGFSLSKPGLCEILFSEEAMVGSGSQISPIRMRVGGNNVKIIMLGLRGIPNVQGGVETHVEHISQELVRNGCEVEVLARSPYVPASGQWNGVKITRIWSPRSKYFETIVHSFLGILYAAWKRPDILHIHAIGPALVVPFGRLFGLHVVVTHHGFDYDRQKWNLTGKLLLRLGERLGMRLSNARIAVSSVIAASVGKRFQVSCNAIPNGIELPTRAATHSVLDRFSIRPSRYILNVSRLVPEKRHLDLIAAFSKANLPDWQLVIVGNADHNDGYVETLKKRAREAANVVMTGKLVGLDLAEIYSNAGIFALASSHEGLSIVLLEAMSYDLPILASDIAANLAVGLPAKHYYPLADVAALSKLMQEFVAHPMSKMDLAGIRNEKLKSYAWPVIASQTLQCYRECIGPGSSAPFKPATQPVRRQ